MAKTGKITNQKLLDDLAPEVKEKYLDLFNKLTKEGFSISLNSSQRSFEKQEGLFITNPAAAVPGYSPHNSGLGIDFNVTTPGGKTLTSDEKDKGLWIESGLPQIFENNGFRWGGNSFGKNYDPIHIDLVGNKKFEKYNKNTNLTPEQKERRDEYKWADDNAKKMTNSLGIKRNSKAFVDYRNFYLEIVQRIHQTRYNISNRGGNGDQRILP